MKNKVLDFAIEFLPSALGIAIGIFVSYSPMQTGLGIIAMYLVFIFFRMK